MFFKFGKNKAEEKKDELEDRSSLFEKFNEIKESLNILTEEIVEPEEEIIQEAEAIEDAEEIENLELSDEEKNRPVYILGDNPLAWFLAIKIKESGEIVKIITDKNSGINDNNITLVENHSLQKTNHKIETTFWLRETPKILIITSDSKKLNASLTALSRNKLQNVPILLFTPIIDIKYIKEILNNDIYQAFFDGYLMEKPNQVNLYGRSAKICLELKKDKKINKTILDIFEKSGLATDTTKKGEYLFWENFGIYAICSVISAVSNKTIFDIIKDKDLREEALPIISEFCEIAKSNKIDINYDETLKKIYSTPLGYSYPLQIALSKAKSGDIDLISSNLMNLANKKKSTNKNISVMLKKIYRILSK